MVQATAYLSQDIRARRIAFLEAGETLTRAEREELSELRTAGHEYRPHVERSTDEIKATLAYQRCILGEQSRSVRVVAKSSLAARAALRVKFTRWGSYDCRCIRSSLRSYLGAYTLTRQFVRTLEAELATRLLADVLRIQLPAAAFGRSLEGRLSWAA